MQITKQELPKSQLELTVELPYVSLEEFFNKAVATISAQVKIEGFRPGKAPINLVKKQVGEMAILEEAARLAINKNLDEIIEKNNTAELIGQPQVSITKLAPNNPLEYKIILTLLPKIELENYKDLKLKEEKSEVKPEEVDKVINELCEAQTKEAIVDRAVIDNDKAVVDIKMFLDKVPLDGGQGNGVAIIIGKDYIIPGFDKQLIGAKKDEVRKFDLPYPSDHHQKNLAGKKVEFEVTIKEVYGRQVPEANDELAVKFGLKNLIELKDNIKKSLLQEGEQKIKQKTELAILDKLISQAKISELPDSLVENEKIMMLKEMEYSLEGQGAKLDDYLASIKKTKEQLLADFLPDAIKRVKSILLIRYIFQTEKLKVEAKEIDEEIAKLSKMYQHDQKIVEKLKTHEYRHFMSNQLANRVVMEKLREWNVN